MTARRISTIMLSAALALLHVTTGWAHVGSEADEGQLFAGDSLPLALFTSFVLGVLCYVVMVWDPMRARK
jgi:hypothetical protein